MIGGISMIKHIIIWTLKSNYTADEKAKIKAGIKENLEGLFAVSRRQDFISFLLQGIAKALENQRLVINQ